MARIRTIKPEFWTSEQIAECSPNARLTFVGMWNFCDDYGVHPASCARLKMQIFPADAFTKSDVRGFIEELINNDLIQEYEVDGETYWHVKQWDKHQRLDQKTGKYPRPDGKIGEKIRRMNSEYSANEQRTFDAHSPPEKEKEKEKENKTIAQKFAQFWEAYPLKKSKTKAEKIFAKINPDDELLQAMIRAIGEQEQERQRLLEKNDFCPSWKHPTTWLNGECWNDEVQHHDPDSEQDDFFRSAI